MTKKPATPATPRAFYLWLCGIVAGVSPVVVWATPRIIAAADSHIAAVAAAAAKSHADDLTGLRGEMVEKRVHDAAADQDRKDIRVSLDELRASMNHRFDRLEDLLGKRRDSAATTGTSKPDG